MLLFRGREGPWSVAGNGGRIAEARRKLSGDKSKGKTSSKNAGKRASRSTTARMDGTEQLRQAVDRLVGLNSEKLAAALTNEAMGGGIATAKALVELVEGKKPRPEPKKKRRGPSLAERWAMAPQWEGPEWQGDDQGIGNREQGIGSRE